MIGGDHLLRTKPSPDAVPLSPSCRDILAGATARSA
jgi:hypothetical protein